MLFTLRGDCGDCLGRGSTVVEPDEYAMEGACGVGEREDEMGR